MNHFSIIRHAFAASYFDTRQPSTMAAAEMAPLPVYKVSFNWTASSVCFQFKILKLKPLLTPINMHFSIFALSAVAAFATSALADGNAVVQNLCPSSVFLWPVGGGIGERVEIPAGSSYSEQFHRDPNSGGIALKITRTAGGLFDGSPQLIYAYTLTTDEARVFYDLSAVFGNAFEGNNLFLDPAESSCPEIYWDDGIPPGGSQVRDCVSGSNITLNLCHYCRSSAVS
jgi:hypothetical protein